MENALLVGLSRQAALHREMDVIANNLANLGTTGFKGENMMFEQYLASPAREDLFPPQDRRVAFVQDRETRTNFAQGPLEQTGSPFDLAIQGDGFFVVSTPDGERYTRNGSFNLNNAGELVTSDGFKVSGESGPIVFDQNDTDIAIARDGTISVVNNGVSNDKGRVRLVRFESQQQLKKEGLGLFSASGSPTPSGEKATLMQGAIEKSNVSPIREIGRMIEVSRAYTALANLMTRTDELRGNAINKLADVPA